MKVVEEKFTPIKRSKVKGIFVGLFIAILYLGISLLLSFFVIGIPMLFLSPLVFIIAPIMGLGYAQGKCPNCNYTIERMVGWQEGLTCRKCKKRVIFTENGLRLA